MDISEKLFGSPARVRIIKLFLFNPEMSFDTTSVSQRAKISRPVAAREIGGLRKMGFLKQKSYFKEFKKQENRKLTTVRRRAMGWCMDDKFKHKDTLESFLTNLNSFKNDHIIGRLAKTGKIQLLIAAGIFIKNDDSRVDLFVVGDGMKEDILSKVISEIEAELGREIRYAVFETSEFRYRVSVFDRLVRDVLEYPHEKILNKLGV